MLSSLKPLFFHSLKNEWRFSDNAGAYAPESNKSESFLQVYLGEGTP